GAAAVQAATHRRTAAPPGWVDAVNGTPLSNTEQLLLVAAAWNDAGPGRKRTGRFRRTRMTTLFTLAAAITFLISPADLHAALFVSAIGVGFAMLSVWPALAACVAGASPTRLAGVAVLPAFLFLAGPWVFDGFDALARPDPVAAVAGTVGVVAVAWVCRRHRPGAWSIALHAWSVYLAAATLLVYVPLTEAAPVRAAWWSADAGWLGSVDPFRAMLDAAFWSSPASPSAAVGMVLSLWTAAASVLYEAVVGYDRLAGRVEARAVPKTPSIVGDPDRVRRSPPS
ncbi:MAG: hypothetical protein ACRDD1_11620, partial [Planctomycetia bacterium]